MSGEQTAAAGRAVACQCIDMQQAVFERSELCFIRADSYFSRSFRRAAISFDLRGQAAGMAIPSRNLLRFNQYMYQHNRDDFLRQTVPHEVAHLLVYQLYGGSVRPHGQQWQRIMREVFGLPARRCHNYAVQPGWKTRYLYRCNCRQHEFTGQRHACAKRGRQYSCRSCGALLEYSGEVRKVLA